MVENTRGGLRVRQGIILGKMDVVWVYIPFVSIVVEGVVGDCEMGKYYEACRWENVTILGESW